MSLSIFELVAKVNEYDKRKLYITYLHCAAKRIIKHLRDVDIFIIESMVEVFERIEHRLETRPLAKRGVKSSDDGSSVCSVVSSPDDQSSNYSNHHHYHNHHKRSKRKGRKDRRKHPRPSRPTEMPVGEMDVEEIPQIELPISPKPEDILSLSSSMKEGNSACMMSKHQSTDWLSPPDISAERREKRQRLKAQAEAEAEVEAVDEGMESVDPEIKEEILVQVASAAAEAGRKAAMKAVSDVARSMNAELMDQNSRREAQIQRELQARSMWTARLIWMFLRRWLWSHDLSEFVDSLMGPAKLSLISRNFSLLENEIYMGTRSRNTDDEFNDDDEWAGNIVEKILHIELGFNRTVYEELISALCWLVELRPGLDVLSEK